MQDKEIVALYFDRNEKAIEYTQQKYRAYCHSVAHRLLRDEQDDEECLNDVWLAAWESIPPNRPLSLKSYLGRITRNLSAKRLRDINRKKRGKDLTVYLEELSDALPADDGVESSLESAALKEMIERFLKRQSEVNRSLFICRYYYLDSVGELALRFGLSENSVKLRLLRLRQKLREELVKEGIV